jgi:hypothetical protein
MLTSPVTVTLSGVDHSLSRINQDNFASVYLKKWALNELRLTIRHTYEGKAGVNQNERHNVELKHTKWDAEGNETSLVVYWVGRLGRSGDPAALAALSSALTSFLGTNITAIASWES